MAQSLDSQESERSRPVERTCLVDAPWYAGDIIAGRYQLETLIAEGGMGLVFRAQHLILEQPIALKLVRPTLVRHPVAVARFLDEARVIARLKSPHVVHVFDSGTVEDGTPYMALELLNGWDLHALLERDGPLSFELAADYVIQACRAVAEAHSLGIVHRDLKPENLFLHRDADGAPIIKVLDFGISKHLQRGEGRSHTVEGEAVGSPHYMAPEQMAAKEVDRRADIWSLGVVLFELVTGAVPFEGGSMAELYSALSADDAPPLSSFRQAVPPAFQEVVSRCLRKDPAERYARAGELAEALERFVSGESSLSSASDRPTMISVAPGVQASNSPRIVLRRAGRNPGWAVLGLMATLAAGTAVANGLGVEPRLSHTTTGTSFELAPSVAESTLPSLAAKDASFAPIQVDVASLAVLGSARPASARIVATETLSPAQRSRPAVVHGSFRRVAAPATWNAAKSGSAPRSASATREGEKTVPPRLPNSTRAGFDELIPPYGALPELRAEANGSKR